METDSLPLKTPDLGVFFAKVRKILSMTRNSHYVLFSADVRSAISQAIRRKEKILRKLPEEFLRITANGSKELEEVGMAGADLELKLRVFDKLSGRFHRIGGMPALLDLLDYVNSMLTSLLKFLPQLESIIEVIDVIGKLIKLTRNGIEAPEPV